MLPAPGMRVDVRRDVVSHRRSPRLPFEPLRNEANAATICVLAERVGVAPRTILRWARHGVPATYADRAAIAVGSHPAYIWPDHWNRT